MKKFYKAMLYRMMLVTTCFISLFLIASGNSKNSNTVSNMNGVKSVEAIHIVSKYNNQDKKLDVMAVSSIDEIKKYGPTNPISFTGQMTAYKANCVGCSGKVSCPPRQDVRNGNIYFSDSTYGTVRILAADSSIPCGTIVQFSNVSFSTEPVIGIVLDRGGAIKGTLLDFLVPETDDMNTIGRQQSVHYEILRWGW